MCQYTSRCPVGRHNPGTVCKYASAAQVYRATSVSTAPNSRTARAAAATRTPEWRSDIRVAASTGGGDALSLLLVLVVVHVNVANSWTLAGWLMSLLLPLAIGLWFSARCGAWKMTSKGRCTRLRPGIWNRCQDHSGLTLPDVLAAVSFLVAVLAAYVWANH